METCRHGVGMGSAPPSYLSLRPISAMCSSPSPCQSPCVFFFEVVIMPQLPLRRRLLEDLDDIDRSFKHARLFSYMQDVTTEPFTLLSASDGSSTSSISSISSISLILSLDLDDKSSVQPSLSLSFLDVEEVFFLATQAKIDKLRQEILTSRVLRKNPAVKKASQLHLLEHWRTGNLDQYRRRVRVDPSTFDGIVNKICTHQIFHNNSNTPQAPVEVQLAIFLFHAGHYGNAASPEVIGQLAGVSLGMVANCTNRVMVSLLVLHDECIHLPTAEEQESAKAWVTAQVCPEWSDGYLLVDGTKFSLFQQPGLHGDAWFDKNRAYSLDCQVRSVVCLSSLLQADSSLAYHPSRLPHHCGLRCRSYWQRPRFLGVQEYPYLQGTRAYLGPRRMDMGRLSISIQDLVCCALSQACRW